MPNTVEMEMENGDRIIRFHNTNIITFRPDGSVTFDTGGWQTFTTKERMNTLSKFSISQSGGVWYINPRGHYEGEQYVSGGDSSVFYDGITFKDGRCISGIHAVDDRDVRRLKRLIRKFVNKIDTLGEIPLPDAGDCWYCYFPLLEATGRAVPEYGVGEVEDGKLTVKPMSWTERGRMDTEHLKNHVYQGYLHGSLIYAAMWDAGYRQDQIGFMYRHFRDIVKRTLYRYLSTRLVPCVKQTEVDA